MSENEYEVSYEGILISIPRTRVVRSFTERKIKELGTILVIDHQGVEKEIDFPGIVYPDSIGNKVKYSKWEKRDPISHPCETLVDLDLNRHYEVFCEHF